MATSQQAIRTYFAKLGLEPEIADIYLALHTHGPQHLSQLARSSGVERTRIYRLIDQLLDSELIEVQSKGARGIATAAPIANLHILIRKKEEELKSLHDELGLVEQLLAHNSLSSPGVRLQLYHGRDGIRHMLGNELRATAPIVGYASAPIETYVGKDFWQTWQKQLREHHISRQLAPASHVTPAGQSNNNDKQAPSCSIYSDVVAYYLWKDDDMYGVELYNKELADMQRLLIAPLLAHRAKRPRSSKSPA